MNRLCFGFLHFDLRIPDALSLKSKRFVLKSLKDRIRAKFHVSVAEAGDLDKWQRADLGVAMAANDRKALESAFQKILDFARQESDIEILSHETEYL
ncbi:MAG: DUF503 domain-containing protein [Candidatus Omnitrophica bacterium]|nr:DUF503 domain-containing protein [Candidatus Omnitrophota bacterium]